MSALPVNQYVIDAPDCDYQLPKVPCVAQHMTHVQTPAVCVCLLEHSLP